MSINEILLYVGNTHIKSLEIQHLVTMIRLYKQRCDELERSYRVITEYRKCIDLLTPILIPTPKDSNWLTLILFVRMLIM